MGVVLAATDPGVLSFSATVSSAEDREVRLDHSYFYPEGGGQPPDKGHIDGNTVIDVQAVDDGIVHVLESEPEFGEGATVSAQIDPAFRAYCQRIHTASHVVYGAGRRVLDDLGYGGFGIDSEKARIDFRTPNPISTDEVVELERLANRVVWEHREVSWTVLPAEEALELDEIAFNTKTEEGVTGGEIRVVEIDEWDVAACGGTHVTNTGEIGPITILGRSNPGEGLTRIELAVGPLGISQRAREKQSLLNAAEHLGAAPDSLGAKIEDVDEKINELEQRKQTLESSLVNAWKDQVTDSVVTVGDTRWLVSSLDPPESGFLDESARNWVGEVADVIILVEESPRQSVVVASDARSAEEIITSVVSEFGGGGGGNASFAQAGGLDADPASVVAFIKEQVMDTA